MIASYWYYRSLVPKNDLRDPCRYDADPELARVIAFDDGDIGKANALSICSRTLSRVPPRSLISALTGTPAMRAVDQRNTCETPCSPTT